MHDVGRNFQSIEFLKTQINFMSQYKLNIFHFHLTEDIAWRLQSKMYPQLTAASTMLRNPGEYYTLQELKELNEYCKKKFITLIPEIDMPGHSAAFKRALGIDMQTPEGLIACKNILTEICSELGVPLLSQRRHAVKITDPNSLPLISDLHQSLHTLPLAEEPGETVRPRNPTPTRRQ